MDDNNEFEMQTVDLLNKFGVPKELEGYEYLKQAIVFTCREAVIISSVTKVLYPTLAKIFNVTPSHIEHEIRHAIEITWDESDMRVLNSFFGFIVRNSKGRPTNSEFIATVADELRIMNDYRIK